MLIRTKIIATIGPASGHLEMLRKLADAGVDVFRINFSHGNQQQWDELLGNVRTVEAETGEPLAVMADLCGPKMRVGKISGGPVLLDEGGQIRIQQDPIIGDAQRISTTMGNLIEAFGVGDSLLLDDGKIHLEVTDVEKPGQLVCKVIRGGLLEGHKGINVPGVNLGISALTEDDRRHVQWMASKDFDYLALSFVQSADDVSRLRDLLDEIGCHPDIIAKIEKPQALVNISEIIDVSDGIMVARGDLGVEMDLPRVPVAQKRIAGLCRQRAVPCIIATQMLESMTHSAVPTRAEVSDVGNAVLDHADAVMLSGETAVGQFPVEAVRMMDRVVQEVQAYHDETDSACEMSNTIEQETTAALGSAVRAVLKEEDIAAVAVFTATGTTARLLAKMRLSRPILAMSGSLSAVRKMCLYYGVQPTRADAPKHTRDVLTLASKLVLERHMAQRGDKIVVLSGRPIGQPGATNTLVVHTV